MCKKSLLLLIALCATVPHAYAQYFGDGSAVSTLFFDADGKTFVWGDNSYGPGSIGPFGLGDTSESFRVPIEVPSVPGVSRWIGGSFGLDNGVYIGDDSNLYFTGVSYDEDVLPSYFGSSTLYYPTKWPNPLSITGWQSALISWKNTKLLLSTNGQAYFWGRGIDSIIHEPTLVTLPQGITGWKKIAVGSYHCLLLSEDDRMYAFGDNTYGQLGDNSNSNKSRPVQIYTPPGIYEWKAMYANNEFSLGIDINGKLYHWGKLVIYIGGEFTIGSQEIKPTPYTTDEIWKDVKIGDAGLILGLTESGKIYVWGGYDSIVLGLGDGRRRLAEPALLPFPEGVTEWRDFSIAAFNSYALDQDCRVWGWGYNGSQNPIGLPPDSGSVFPRPRLIHQFCQQNDVSVSNTRTKLQLKIYPNPASEKVSLEFFLETSQQVEIAVLDILGRTMRTFNGSHSDAGSHSYSIPLDGIPPGDYIIRLQANSGVASASLIVK